jgi:hypothetical protein
MCERCKEIDAQIAHFAQLQREKTDKVFLAGLAEVLKNYLAEKAALHPEQK